MALSKTARLAMNAGMDKNTTKEDLSPATVIAKIRNQRESGLFVNRMDFIDIFLAEYDRICHEFETMKRGYAQSIEAREPGINNGTN